MLCSQLPIGLLQDLKNCCPNGQVKNDGRSQQGAFIYHTSLQWLNQESAGQGGKERKEGVHSSNSRSYTALILCWSLASQNVSSSARGLWKMSEICSCGQHLGSTHSLWEAVIKRAESQLNCLHVHSLQVLDLGTSELWAEAGDPPSCRLWEAVRGWTLSAVFSFICSSV